MLTASLRPFGAQPLDHCGKFAIARASYLRVGTDSAACRFGDRAGPACGHRDTIAYPATQNVTGSVATIPWATFSIVNSFLVCSPAGGRLRLDRRRRENVISCRQLRSRRAQRKTIARGLMFTARWMQYQVRYLTRWSIRAAHQLCQLHTGANAQLCECIVPLADWALGLS